MPIKSLQIESIGPFSELELEFDPQVNVLIGPNNCGKSTLLLALAAITCEDIEFPRKLLRPVFNTFHVQAAERLYDGTLVNTSTTPLNYRRIDGFSIFVPAVRLTTDFRPRGPSSDVTPTGYRFLSDEHIVQRMINVDYRALRNQPGRDHPLHSVARVASSVTEGFRLRFMGVREDAGGLYPCFETPDGELSLNALSQGTQSLLQWLSLLIFSYAEFYKLQRDFAAKPGLLLIDEIDAHFHPSWQRRIIPALTDEFPKLQIICSSHSPLMLAGLKAGQVTLLSRDETGVVRASRNESDLVGWTTDEIVTTFLGVRVGTDIETDRAMSRLETLRAKPRLTPSEKSELEKLRADVGRRVASGPNQPRIEEFVEQIKSIQRSPVKSNGDSAPAPKRSARRSAKPAKTRRPRRTR